MYACHLGMEEMDPSKVGFQVVMVGVQHLPICRSGDLPICKEPVSTHLNNMSQWNQSTIKGSSIDSLRTSPRHRRRRRNPAPVHRCGVVRVLERFDRFGTGRTEAPGPPKIVRVACYVRHRSRPAKPCSFEELKRPVANTEIHGA